MRHTKGLRRDYHEPYHKKLGPREQDARTLDVLVGHSRLSSTGEVSVKLREAVAQVLTRPLTYREITALVNEMHLYRTLDGMLVPGGPGEGNSAGLSLHL